VILLQEPLALGVTGQSHVIIETKEESIFRFFLYGENREHRVERVHCTVHSENRKDKSEGHEYFYTHITIFKRLSYYFFLSTSLYCLIYLYL